MITGACRVQKRESDPLKLELEVVVSHPMWVPGHEHGISAKAKHTTEHALQSCGCPRLLISKYCCPDLTHGKQSAMNVNA